MKSKRFVCSMGSVALAILVLAPLAQAGPPLLCWPFAIGDAKSLPWGGSGWHALDAGYDTARLIEDTLALLTPQTPVLVRMETLRRATIYADSNPRLAQELAAKLLERAQSAEAKGHADALAWFDAGYLLQTYRDTRELARERFVLSAEDGYTLVQKAIHLRGNDAEMEFAAAIIAANRSKGAGRDHVRRALAGAREGSLLARNLVSHALLINVRGTSLAELRADVENTRN